MHSIFGKLSGNECTPNRGRSIPHWLASMIASRLPGVAPVPPTPPGAASGPPASPSVPQAHGAARLRRHIHTTRTHRRQSPSRPGRLQERPADSRVRNDGCPPCFRQLSAAARCRAHVVCDDSRNRCCSHRHRLHTAPKKQFRRNTAILNFRRRSVRERPSSPITVLQRLSSRQHYAAPEQPPAL
jgi:hypothetical protein